MSSTLACAVAGRLGPPQTRADRIPAVYASEVLETPAPTSAIDTDPNKLAMIKHFKSPMPMAQDARKPMFLLKPADGAVGSHAAAVQDCHAQFRDLGRRILIETTLSLDASRHMRSSGS